MNAKNEYGATPLHAAAWNNENPEVLTLLIKAGADVNAKNEYGSTPLHSRRRQREPRGLTLLIKAGADVNAKDNDG